jgi:YebC/PmpR family DNA-binding regulatory protein
MSGHSKWSKIQHKKGKNDAKRGVSFTKLCRAVTVTAAEGGADPDMNFSLRLALVRAKQGNVPKDNIERAIKRGTGELKDAAILSEGLYEGFGSGGVAVLVETVTDNVNRCGSEIKHFFSKHGGSLGAPGSVKWQFERLGVARFKILDLRFKNDIELKLIDAGTEDIVEDQDGMEIWCSIEKLQTVLEVLKSFEIEPEESGLEWVAKEKVEADDNVLKKIKALYGALEENDDVKEVYTNLF